MLKSYSQKILKEIKPLHSEQDIEDLNKFLKDLLVAEIFACNNIVEVEKAEWGDVAVSVSKTTKNIINKLNIRSNMYEKK